MAKRPEDDSSLGGARQRAAALPRLPLASRSEKAMIRPPTTTVG